MLEVTGEIAEIESMSADLGSRGLPRPASIAGSEPEEKERFFHYPPGRRFFGGSPGYRVAVQAI